MNFRILFFLALVGSSAIAQVQPQVRIALVIGAQNYTSVAPLRHALNDAQDMAAILRAKGFRVEALYDPRTKKEIKDAVTRYYNAMVDHSGAVGLIYYAGHGIQYHGDNYLIPVGADLQNPGDVEDQGVKLNSVMAVVESPNSLNIFLLDACRKNMFASFSRDVQQGLSKVSAPQGSIVVFATQPGTVASDGTGRNGLFTSKIIKYINEPDLNIGDVFKKVKQDVFKESEKAQLPSVEDNSIGGDFFFGSSDGSTGVKVQSGEPARSEAVPAAVLTPIVIVSPYDTIFSNRGKMAVNIREITDDAVKYSFPGEDLTNSIFKNNIYRIRLKSGRIQEFNEIHAFAVIKSGEDWEKVTITQLEGELKGLFKLEEISTKATGTTAFANASSVRERAVRKLKIQGAMLGANTIFMTDHKSTGTPGGGLFASGAAKTVVSGIAYASQRPDFNDFMKIVDKKKEYAYVARQFLGESSADLGTESRLAPSMVSLSEIRNVNGFIVLKANIRGEESTEFRVTYFDDTRIVLMSRDKSKIYNDILQR
jgi:hypothetical protein